MVSVIFSWIVLFFVFLAFGEMMVSLWNIATKRKDSYSLVNYFWIGISTVGTLLLYLSIFIPLNIWVLSAILTITLVYWIINRKDLIINHFGKITVYIKSLSYLEKSLFTILFLIVLIYSLCTPLIYDEGLYHLQTMQWTEKYKTIVGLGNIHGRLGFNSSFLLLSTVFNYHPQSFNVFFTINSLSLLVFCFWLLAQIKKSQNIIQSTSLVMVLIISVFTLGANIASTSTDILPQIFILYILVSWVMNKYFIGKNILLLTILPVFCVTLKLSSAVILATTLVCIIWLIQKNKRKEIFAVIAIGCFIAIPYIVRFIISTGYIVYPFPAIDILSVDWKIPLEMVTLEKDLAYAWARIPNMEHDKVLTMSFSEWFPIWLKNLSLYNLTLYILVAISFIVVAISYKISQSKTLLVAWSIALLGIIFSLLTAPDFRFSFGFIVSAATLPFIVLGKRSGVNPKLKSIIYYSLLALFIGLGYVASSQTMRYLHLSEDSALQLLFKPQSIDLLEHKIDRTFKEYKLNNTTIFVPVGTDQCFEQTIPCTPYMNNIERRGDKLDDGFRIKNR